MNIYQGKSLNLKKYLTFAKVTKSGREEREDYTQKGLLFDIMQSSCQSTDFSSTEETIFDIKPCTEEDHFESGAVSSESNNAMLTMLSSQKGNKSLNQIYKSFFGDDKAYVKHDDFFILQELKRRYTLHLICYDEIGGANGWVAASELKTLVALELIERFRDEYGYDDMIVSEEYTMDTFYRINRR